VDKSGSDTVAAAVDRQMATISTFLNRPERTL